MNGHIAEERLALYAGGDLPEEESAAVRKHVADCPRCAALLAELKDTRDLAGLAAGDEPPSVPADFTARVMAAAGQPAASRRPVRWFRITTWHKVAASAAILATVFWAGRLSQQSPEELRFSGTATPTVTSSPGVTVDGALLRMLPVVGPLPLDGPLPESAAGVYLILYRPDPDNAPDRYTVEFVGERTGADSGDIMRNITCLTDRAGSRENIYIVLYPMPASSEVQRALVAQALIQTYKPYCNSGV